MLHLVHHGSGAQRPLIIAHGLLGSARNWGVISKRLSVDRPVISVDMRNHGASPWFDSNTYQDMADDLAAIIAPLGGRADVLGHSMGGKSAMALALAHPRLVAKLVIVDIAPVTYHHSQAPLIEALQGVDPTRLTSRRDADELLRPKIEDAATRAFLLQNLDMKSTPKRWSPNLVILKKFMPEIIGFPEFNTSFDGPTLFLRGDQSVYIRANHHAVIAKYFPKSQHRVI